jgi:hypothetical protein
VAAVLLTVTNQSEEVTAALLMVIVISFGLTTVLHQLVVHFTVCAVSSAAEVVIGSCFPMAMAFGMAKCSDVGV